MNKEQALLRELARVRSLKRALEKENKKLKEELRTMKLDKIKNMITVEISELNKASLLLTSLSEPSGAIEQLASEIELFNKSLAQSIREEGISYRVLYSDKRRGSRYYQSGASVDTEEWYVDSSKQKANVFGISDHNSEHYDKLRTAIDHFEEAILSQVFAQISKLGITRGQLDALAEESE